MSELEQLTFDALIIEYLDDAYHFSVTLPKEWEGYEIITEHETGDIEFDTLSKNIDSEYVVFRIRHPEWTVEEPYQDIALVIFRTKQWNDHVTAATNGNFDLLPHMLPSSSSHVIRCRNRFTKDTFLRCLFSGRVFFVRNSNF